MSGSTVAPFRPGGVPRRGGRAPAGQGWAPWNQRLAPYLFVLPNMLIFGVFIIYPAINAFNVSRFDSRNGRTFTPVGARNYDRLFSDEDFWAAAWHTAVFVCCYVTLSVVVAIGLGILLNQRIRFRGFFRAVVFLPKLLSPVVVGLIFGWILDRRVGLLNNVLGAVGLPQPSWLTNGTLAMVCTVSAAIWLHVGFYTLIILAGLQGIDPTYYEAAQIDGATAAQRFRRITLPLLAPTTMVVLILSTIEGFQAFDFIYSLTGGGPVGATTLIVQYIYEHAFRSPVRYGLAAAGSVVLFCTIFALTLLNFWFGRRRESI
jgi:alpha-1,4-digalacturonate transport system permease protein